MPPEPVKTALSREVKRALLDAGLSAPAAARKLKWDRKRIYRWIDGEVSPRLEDIEAFAKAVGPLRLDVGGTTKNATPSEEGAAQTLLDIWQNGDGPKWAYNLTDTIVKEIQRLRNESVERMILDAVRGAGAGLREQILDELTRVDVDQKQ